MCITSTTKMLTVSVLVCAMMALTRADAVPTGEPDLNSGPEGSSKIVVICAGNWTGYRGRCFMYVPSPMIWVDAEKHCQTLGGNLASVHSSVEQLTIQTMIQLQDAGFPETWLGGYDAVQEGTWFWSDGTPFDYTYWAPGEPGGFLNADCLLMNYGDAEKFADQPCGHLKPFVCGKNFFAQPRHIPVMTAEDGA